MPQTFQTIAASSAGRDGKTPDEDCGESPPGLMNGGVLRMCRIWEAALGASPVRPDDDYFVLGGKSLEAIEILSEVQRVFGTRLPLSALFTAPTSAQLATLALAGIDPDSPPLVRLSSRGEGPPLFLIPGAGDNAFAFDTLLRAADLDRPVHGFRLPPAGSGGFGPSALVEIAGRSVVHLLAVQPEGPYYLGGYSFGGRLAFEMARQLEAAGRRVAFLGLIDTYGRGYPPPLPALRRLWSHVRAAAHPNIEERRKYRRERLLRISQRVMGLAAGLAGSLWSDRLSMPEFIREDCHYHWWLSRSYVPSVYAGRLTLFRASVVPKWVGTDFSDPYLGWGPLTAGGMEVRPVSGDHLSLLDEPHVGSLAASLKACLAR